MPLGPDETHGTLAYLQRITTEAGLKTRYEWQGGHVRVLPA